MCKHGTRALVLFHAILVQFFTEKISHIETNVRHGVHFLNPKKFLLTQMRYQLIRDTEFMTIPINGVHHADKQHIRVIT